jgi:hypothetical protein
MDWKLAVGMGLAALVGTSGSGWADAGMGDTGAGQADRLSLVPLVTQAPDALVLGTQRAAELKTLNDAELQEVLTLSLPPIEEPTLLDAVGEVIQAQDVDWPLGTLTTAHFAWPDADKIGTWKPFLSLLQESDELDAHVRNGIGAGLTFRLNESARVDVEGMFLQSSGDVNPNLGDEGRVSVVFSMTF